ncbi:hypothetical protein J4573_18180 [Actinomadura barringtoniae]|uniref:Uncharacterized protein n=1 Tax=Actinomadura barringtoniae TaxID=1427535 RepID=A0A939PA77_9ACTN|nr:hypothetical protein [Actinomadura barringtoniae]MBO2449037.1 hypothetical protein [Actinomadura barringtoniae]
MPDLQGPWSDEAVRQTLMDYFGVGSDVDLPDELRFLANVARLLQKRIREGELEASEQRPALFFLHPQRPNEVPSRSMKRVPMLDNGVHAISGKLWFVNQIASDGSYIELMPEEDDEAIFDLATNTLNAGTFPAVVFETRTVPVEARFYPYGLLKTDTFQVVRLEETALTFDQIFESIDRLYESKLCTPDAQSRAGKLWADASKSWVADDAEDQIQHVVHCGLIGFFPTCTIRIEQSQATGRLDVEIEEPLVSDRSQIVRHAILELKVLRSKNSRGNSVSASVVQDWVRKGVEQASAYRDERGSRLAALCCFDMRLATADDCFEPVKELAEQLVVELRSWYLFPSSEAYRRHLTENREPT